MQRISIKCKSLEAHSRTHDWLKPHRLICKYWALPISRAVPPVALIFRVWQLSPLQALISQTAEFHYKELQWLSAELRDEALRRAREWVEKVEHDQITWSGWRIRDDFHSCEAILIAFTLTEGMYQGLAWKWIHQLSALIFRKDTHV